ncbi:MAG: DUF2199 domain-containing protein [Rhodothermia bacterium]|nr:DUF2199 domain-containing protein [Rhodothermia bacterium]
MSYVCSCCGKTHKGLPDVGFDQPALALDVPDHERDLRVSLGSDLCVVDDEHHFVRGVIEIPVADYASSLGIGAWVSQKAENFQLYAGRPDSSSIGPFFGWLSNDVGFGDQSSLHLKAMVHYRDGSQRPFIELEPTVHPLSVAQREGITLDAAWTFVHKWIDP